MADVTKTLDDKEHLEDGDEISELQPGGFYDMLCKQAERFASNRLGQFIFERADRALKMIEDTAKWSLPPDNTGTPLARPLPWVPFLMLIVLLRLTRVWLSVGAIMIGNGPVKPGDIIYFIQTRRRKLRAIRVHGLKAMRQRQLESGSGAHKGYVQRLSEWLSHAICQPGVQRAESGRLLKVRNVQQQTSQEKTMTAAVKRPRDEDAQAEHNMTIDEMLAKYANENSEDDSDFVPNAADETNDDSSSSATDSSSESSCSGSEQDNERKNTSVIVVENGSHKAHKPLVEVKAEPKSDSERQTARSNGNSSEPTEVAKRMPQLTSRRTDNDNDNDNDAADWKGTPGHVSAAMTKMELYSMAGDAGSPTAFNTIFGPQSVLKNATVHSVATHSTPNSQEEGEPQSEPSDAETEVSKHISIALELSQSQSQSQLHQRQQQRQHQQHQQRYRGRNRR